MMENTENMQCPFCNGEISPEAKKCKHCGEWVVKEEDLFPQELKRFNWGAFLLNWIWGVMHKKYITLLYFLACFIPILGPLVISIWFGIAGNKWAWNSKNWASIEEFNEVQKNWVRIWFILAGLGIIITLKVIFVILLISNIQI